jgi:DNA-binding PadR family transcriptional regulator
MPRRHGPGLSLAEWLVLCLISQEPTHGFALAALLTPDGMVGMAWHVQKGEVYRAVQRLERLGLITAKDRQHSSLGPPRAQLSATLEGHRTVQGWLCQPAGHARDARSELLVKLALLFRAGADPGDLLRAQRRYLVPVADRLAGQLCTTTGFDRTLALWRHESVCSTLRFIDTVLAAAPAPRAETATAAEYEQYARTHAAGRQ